MIDLFREETDKLTDIHYYVDYFEVQGTKGTQRLSNPQLLGYIDESEYSAYEYIQGRIPLIL